jgi:hypothetical protein
MWSAKEIIGIVIAVIAASFLAPLIVKWISKKKK